MSPYRGYFSPAAQKEKRSWKPYYKSNLGILIIIISAPIILILPFLFFRLRCSNYKRFHIGWWEAFDDSLGDKIFIAIIAVVVGIFGFPSFWIYYLTESKQNNFYHPLLRMKPAWE
jgi:hypothetical protein